MKTTLLVGYPSRSGMSSPTQKSLELATRYGTEHELDIRTDWETVGGIPLARNLLFARWYFDTREDFFLSLDNDVCGFTGEDLVRMTSAGEEFVCAPYAHRVIDPLFLCPRARGFLPYLEMLERQQVDRVTFHREMSKAIHVSLGPPMTTFLPGVGPHPKHPTLDHLVEVFSTGAGFMLFSRAGGQRIVEMSPTFRTVLRNGQSSEIPRAWDFRQTHENEFQGEDVDLCVRFRASGGRIWADTKTALGHVGELVFMQAPLEVASLSELRPKEKQP